MDFFIRWLAVVGGAAVGAFLAGRLVGAVARNHKGQNVPSWPAWLVRLFAGLLGGIITYYLVFGSGFGGMGGTGGFLPGTKDAKKDGKEVPKEDKRPKEDKPTGKKGATTTMKVEVLSEDALKKLPGSKGVDRLRCYRLSREAEPVGLKEVVKAIKEGLEAKPRLGRLEIILYKDSPIEDVDVVRNLKDSAKDLNADLKVEPRKLDQYAPVD